MTHSFPTRRSSDLASAQNVSFFRIGTGSTAVTYFPIGGIIASAISSPPGSRDCKGGGSCGVSGLVAVAQSTRAAVDNARQIQQGTLESGFVQSDIAYWAYHGEELFLTGGPLKSLRPIANLYPETIHLVVSAEAGIERSEEHTSVLQSLMRHSYAVFCLKKKTKPQTQTT